MPDYIYRCVICKRDYPVTEPMLTDDEHYCEVCGLRIFRKPQVPTVHWDGLKPSAAEQQPQFIKDFVDDTDRRRDETAAKYQDRT